MSTSAPVKGDLRIVRCDTGGYLIEEFAYAFRWNPLAFAYTKWGARLKRRRILARRLKGLVVE